MTEDVGLSWWQRRLDELAQEIRAGSYFVPAEEIAAAILFGRPKWGENPELAKRSNQWSAERATAISR